jgi:hypothetical protein
MFTDAISFLCQAVTEYTIILMSIQRFSFSLKDSFEPLGCSAEEVEEHEFLCGVFGGCGAGERIEKY